MLIEYKVTFQDDGFTISQRIENGTAAVPTKPGAPVEHNEVAATLPETQAAKLTQGAGPDARDVGGGRDARDVGGGPDARDVGGSGFGSGSMTIFGPFIVLSPPAGSKVKDGN